MIVLNQIFKLIGLLNSEQGAFAIACGFAFGMALGFVPANPLIILLFFFLLFVLRMNGAAFFLAWAVFSVLSFALDPLFDRLGYWLLAENSALRPLFTTLYNLPVVPWTRFNNSIVAGSLVAGVVLLLPAIFIFKFFIHRYRDSLLPRITNSKWVKLFKTTKLYQLYEKYRKVKDAFS